MPYYQKRELCKQMFFLPIEGNVPQQLQPAVFSSTYFGHFQLTCTLDSVS